MSEIPKAFPLPSISKSSVISGWKLLDIFQLIILIKLNSSVIQKLSFNSCGTSLCNIKFSPISSEAAWPVFLCSRGLQELDWGDKREREGPRIGAQSWKKKQQWKGQRSDDGITSSFHPCSSHEGRDPCFALLWGKLLLYLFMLNCYRSSMSQCCVLITSVSLDQIHMKSVRRFYKQWIQVTQRNISDCKITFPRAKLARWGVGFLSQARRGTFSVQSCSSGTRFVSSCSGGTVPWFVFLLSSQHAGWLFWILAARSILCWQFI